MIHVESDSGEEWDSRTDWALLASAAVKSAVDASDYSVLAKADLGIEVSVKFTTDAEVQSLNASYRSKDKATNVLSFPMIEADQIDAFAEMGGETLLGDIVLAHGICLAEAADKGVAMADHAAHLIVHGTLHLLGYDHEQSEEEAETMEGLERTALAAMGIADPYLVNEMRT